MMVDKFEFMEVHILISIETQRLHLRNVRPGDADVVFDYRNNELCSRFQRGQTKDYEGIVQLLERHEDDTLSVESASMVAAAIKETDEMIGEIIVMPNDNTISLGYTFSYQYHRQGYAFEALSALIDIIHGMVPDWEFISFTDPQNAASINLLLKLGYEDLGYIPSMESQAFGKWIKASTKEEIAQLS